MAQTEVMKEIKAKINELLPANCNVSKIEFEGPEVVLYTDTPETFLNDESIIANIASSVKKKVVVRCSKDLLLPAEEAKEIISNIVPKEADIKKMYFLQSFNEVALEVFKPGLVIGKKGEILKQIILKTGWVPKIWRAPIKESKIMQGIRYHLVRHEKERKDFLKDLSKKIFASYDKEQEHWIRLVALGSFREVGRSCMLIETPVSKIMLDCGINIASAKNAYPYLEVLQYPIDRIDAVIISHAHLDHSGFLPYLFKLGYKGPVYCTEPTMYLMSLLQFDYIDVLVKDGKEPIYTERDVKEMLKYVVPRDYRLVTDIMPDVRLTFYNAAHILGSSSVHLHIGNGEHNIVYSGDIKFGYTRLFNAPDIAYPRLETLILESTYGGEQDIQPERQEQEEKLISIINETISKKGNVLIPVFAVGRTQEIMLVLEDAYRQGKLSKDVKCYIDGMTSEANLIHTAFPEYLRNSLKKRILRNDNPFASEIFVVLGANNNKKGEKLTREEILEKGKAIILASSGMLTGGASLEYFKLMADKPENTIIFVGFQAEGSLGRKIISGIKELPVVGKDGKVKKLEIKLRVERLEGFSGHSDRLQLINYVKRIKPRPKRVILNHGEQSKSLSLASYLRSKFRISVNVPHNLDAVRLK